MEAQLLGGHFTSAIVSCFNTMKINAFDPNLLEPLLKVLRLSPQLAASLAKPDMFSGIVQKLGHKKAVVRVNLLRLVRNIMDAREVDHFNSPREKHLRTLLEAIQKMAAEDSAVVARTLAADLVRSHVNGEPDLAHPATSASTAGSGRSRSGPRRIYTPPSLHSAASVPMTPTHAQRPSQVSAYMENTSSPKRTAASMAHERGLFLHRPRSRDGPSGLPASSLPRRVSGDAQAGGHVPTGKSKLSRNSGVLSRPSIGSASHARSESVLSNKENVSTNPRYPRASSPTSLGSHESGVPYSTNAGTGKQRRSRAPSEGKKWGT